MTDKSLYNLVSALDGYFEYNTRVRFEKLWKALHEAMELLDFKPSGWDYGFWLREQHKKEQAEVWGVKDD